MKTVEVYEIEKGLEVLETSIREIGVASNDGRPNRYLMHGIEPDGGHVIWLETDGGPSYLPCADLDGLGAWLEDLGGCPDAKTGHDRISVGLDRLASAYHILQSWYAGNRAACDALDWISDEVGDYVH